MSGQRGKGKGFGFSGFSLSSKDSGGKAAIPPPASLSSSSHSRTAVPPPSGFVPPSGGVPAVKQTNRQGYYTMTSISHNALSAAFGYGQKQKPKTEDEYFDSDEEDKPAYQPAPGSPGETKQANDSDSEEDPLDAFMEGINAKAKYELQVAKDGGAKKTKRDLKGVRDDIEKEDDEESYYRFVAENPVLPSADDTSDTEIEYDADGNPIVPVKSKHIDPLPPIDHSTIEYPPFEKNFYNEPDDIKSLEGGQVEELRNKLGIKVSGALPPKLVTSFAHFGLDEGMMKIVRKQEYTQPTPIQAQAVPTALMGRDVLGIAKTGSGKTAAFVWPMITHILDQPALELKDGPIGLILAPTRELALQIHTEVKKFGRPYGIRVVCCYGGGSKWEQSKALEEGAEIVVATPGRMIDMVKMEATNLKRVTFLVLDEADRMFDMGFEPQVRSICNHVRPDRQTLMFSATFKKKIEKLARDVLVDPVKIVQGDIGEANVDVMQLVEVLPTAQAKWKWLLSHLVEFTAAGSLLIFSTKKADAEQLSANLKVHQTPNELIHGDMDQVERNRVITAFKKKEINILVATDVAARGLDIPHIRTVVNYDVARDIDTHTHRIGRTGRAGEKGTAYTLVTPQDKDFAGHLVRNLEGVGQEPPRPLVDLAMQSPWFRKSRFKADQGRKPGVGGFGLGYVEGKKNVATDRRTATEVCQTVRTANSAAATGGSAMNRLGALKNAFQSQYKQFQVSKEDSIIPSNYKPPSYSSIAGEANRETRPKKRSRWGDTEEESNT